MIPKPMIAVDIDDVLAQGTESLRREVNERLGINLQPEHYAIPGDYWGYYERVWKKNGLQGKITMEELNPQMVKDQSHIPPFKEAREVLGLLKKDYKLIVVTARNPEWEDATLKWLDVQFPGLFESVHFAGHHQGKSKGQLCRELGVEWLIDDNIEHAHTALENSVKVVLFGDYGWHYGKEIQKGVIKCKDWNAIRDYFSGRN